MVCSAPLTRAPTPAESSSPGNARPEPTTRASSPSSCPVPSRLAIEPEWKAQPRLWGHASPDVLVPRELPGGPRPRVHRPLQPARATSSSTRSRGRGTAPLQALAEGRIGVGNDLNPLAHLLTAAKLEPADAGRGAHPARGPPPRLGRRRRRLARPRRPASWPIPATRRRFVPGGRLGRRPRRAPRARPRRGRARVPPADARPAAVPPRAARPRRPRRPLPRRRARRASSTARRPSLPVDDHAQHVQHGAALRPRLRGAHRLRAARARRRSTRLDGQARPALPPAAPARRGIALLGRRADAGRRARAAR